MLTPGMWLSTSALTMMRARRSGSWHQLGQGHGLAARRLACSCNLTIAHAGSLCSVFSQARTSSGRVSVTSWAGRPYFGGRPAACTRRVHVTHEIGV